RAPPDFEEGLFGLERLGEVADFFEAFTIETIDGASLVASEVATHRPDVVVRRRKDTEQRHRIGYLEALELVVPGRVAQDEPSLARHPDVLAAPRDPPQRPRFA